jgi:methionyl-tRNA formyltransferase
MPPLRLVVAGSPEAAVPTLDALAKSDHRIETVITRPPSPQGRKRILTPTPVELAARARGLRVLTARSLSEIHDDLVERDVDLGVIVAYGGLVREPLLSWPRLGWINLHFSLLPAWRGAAPVQHALMAGEGETGLSVFHLTAGLDEGPILAQEREPVGAHDTAGSLLERLSDRGAATVRRVVDELADGTAVATEQQGKPSFAPKLGREDGRIDWTTSAASVTARIRGVTPEPGAFSTLGDGTVVKVLDAAPALDTLPLAAGVCEERGGRTLVGTGDGNVELRRVQPAGKAAMAAADWMRGSRDRAGRVFT